MTKEEIERLKLAGQAKREERRAKREALYKQNPRLEVLPLPADFEERLHAAWKCLEKLYRKDSVSKEKVEEIRQLFLPDATDDLRFRAYRKYFHDYETLIFYSWESSKELCDAAFAFWDSVLSNPEAKVSGNSIIRIIDCRPNKNLLNIMRNHRGKFFEEGCFKQVLETIVLRHDTKPGIWNFEKQMYAPWTDEEKKILNEIKKLF